jgi:hypothetical protein
MGDAVGISSRWTPDQVTPREDQADAGADVRFQGQKYALVIAFQGKESDDASIEAERMLGSMFSALWKLPKFREQAGLLYVTEKKPLTSCVTFPFGDVTLFVAASSSDIDTARVHAIDRLALAVTAMASIADAQKIIKRSQCEVRHVR